ncbi:MAG: RluA family pseudouridine synthase [Bdellovibrionia bacterium]
MPLKKLTVHISQDHAGLRLDQALFLTLPPRIDRPLSKAQIRKLIMAGAVYLNGKRIRIASKELRAHARVDVYLDWEKLTFSLQKQGSSFVMTESHVLFEDDDLIVVDKPPGLPTQPTLDEARENLFAAVQKFLKKREPTSKQPPYLGLHHRLDRDTSGVVLFTKTQRANPGVAELFSTHQIQKTYQALCSFPKTGSRDQAQELLRTLPPHWEVKNYLGKVSQGSKKAKFGAVRSGGSWAHTEFKLLERLGLPGKEAFWVQAQPKTGRTHQIRVHLSEGGTPILGDEAYGGRQVLSSVEVPRLLLHAADLTFAHPIYHNRLSIQSPLPEDFIQCLSAHREGGSGF